MIQIKAIFFDLGNVLVKFDAQIAVRKFANLLETSEEEIWKAVFVSDLERAYSVGKVSSQDFFNSVSQHFQKPIAYEKFVDIWNDIFWANNGMETLVNGIAKRYPIYLISNTNELHFEFIKKNFQVLKHFLKCFPSHEVGHRKPDPGIFHHALQETKVLAKEAVFIDDIPEFVEAAQSVGMHGIHFESREKLEKDFQKLGIIIS
ncbi:MAG: HAD family phosphatase [Candidatus Omnitrophica bacterium]|nr:HAD family phosphatase [Candidatus Omnitrophota bacterium]